MGGGFFYMCIYFNTNSNSIASAEGVKAAIFGSLAVRACVRACVVRVGFFGEFEVFFKVS